MIRFLNKDGPTRKFNENKFKTKEDEEDENESRNRTQEKIS